MDTSVKILTFVNQNPIFKGGSLLILGIIALGFVWYMKRQGEKWHAGIIVFTLISLFLVIYGLFILVFQPQWWLPPR